MIKRRIPEQYEYKDADVLLALRAVVIAQNIALGEKGTGMRGRVLHIDNTQTLTAAQIQAIKDAILPLLSSVQDITV